MLLGPTIKNIRKKKNKSQGEVAQLSNVSQTYLSQLESDKRNPNLEILTKISRALEVPLPIIFFLSLEESDVPEKKRDAFKFLLPTVKTLIHEFFTVS